MRFTALEEALRKLEQRVEDESEARVASEKQLRDEVENRIMGVEKRMESEIGKQLGGYGLYIWIVTGACVSNFGLFLAEMSSDAYQLLGMAELGDPNCDPRLGDHRCSSNPNCDPYCKVCCRGGWRSALSTTRRHTRCF